MARYFFHIFDGEEVFDETGIVLSSIKEARHHMLVVAKAWIENEDHQHCEWRVEARDENENLVGWIRFGIEPDSGNA